MPLGASRARPSRHLAGREGVAARSGKWRGGGTLSVFQAQPHGSSALSMVSRVGSAAGGGGGPGLASRRLALLRRAFTAPSRRCTTWGPGHGAGMPSMSRGWREADSARSCLGIPESSAWGSWRLATQAPRAAVHFRQTPVWTSAASPLPPTSLTACRRQAHSGAL